jgi:hypothetical protein
MSVLKDVLKEELHRLKSLSNIYKREIKKLPKGSISIKHIRNGDYAYLVIRNGDKVSFNYLGLASSKDVAMLKEKIEERRKIKSLMSQTSRNLHEVQSMLRGRQG